MFLALYEVSSHALAGFCFDANEEDIALVSDPYGLGIDLAAYSQDGLEEVERAISGVLVVI